ncbi:MAG: YbgF trimerization domain-containing protein, partial [Pseudomonadota bacterium]
MRGCALMIGVLLAGSVHAEGRLLPPVVDISRQAGSAGPGAAQAGSSNQGLYEMLRRVERLQKEVQQLRGTVEEQAYAIETLKKQQK